MSRLAKPALFCDIDGVLAFQPEGLILAVNARFGESYLLADSAGTYPFFATLPPVQQRWAEANRAVIAANLAPDTRAIRVLQKASKAGISVTVCTERPPALAALTRAWLAYFNVPYGNLAVVGPGGKAWLLEAYGPDNPCLLIDDSPVNIKLARPGVDVWQPARPYNSGGNDVHRFDDWREITKTLGLKR